jgi:hypothetical protein
MRWLRRRVRDDSAPAEACFARDEFPRRATAEKISNTSMVRLGHADFNHRVLAYRDNRCANCEVDLRCFGLPCFFRLGHGLNFSELGAFWQGRTSASA